MMLENCCYGRTELALLKMKREDKFGTIVHASGGYVHDLGGTAVAIPDFTNGKWISRKFVQRNKWSI